MITSIGSKIKELRRKLELCQEDICCEILNQTILSKIEHDKMLPSIPQLEHIANCLHASINYFFVESELQSSSRYSISENKSYLHNLYEQKKYIDILNLYESNGFQHLEAIDVNFYVGMSYYISELYNNALKLLRRYITDYKKLDNEKKHNSTENYAAVLNKLHFIMLKNSNFVKSIKYLYQAKNDLERYQKTATRIYFVIINNIGSTFCRAHKFNETIEVLEKFLNLNKDNTYISILPSIHLSLNVAYYKIHNYTEALKHIKAAIWLFKYTGQNSYAGECYLNYINCLRFQLKLDEALDLADRLVDEYSHDAIMQNLFIVQKMIVLFNMGRFDDLLSLSKDLYINDLRKRSKMEYFFMLGHTEFVHGEYSKSYNHLIKCEKYLNSNKYYTDLSHLYDDLYHITDDPRYTEESERFSQMEGIYNILIKI
jgi:tetratricopeptide (TPR) repeat protein